MKTFLQQLLLTAFLVGCGFLLSQGSASAAPACTLTTPSLTDVINSYDVFSGSGGPSYGPYYIASGGTTTSSTFSFKCAGNFTGPTTTNVTVFFYGISQSGYQQPYLSGPGSSQLNFALCLPTKTCTSLTDTNIWNGGNGYTVNGVTKNQIVYIPQTQIYVPPATTTLNNVYCSDNCGTNPGYSQTIYFYFTCSGYGSC